MQKIKAAKTSTPSTSTNLIYVGKLSVDTKEDEIRSHLSDIGISNDDVADVIKHRTRNEDEASYCISLNTKVAESIGLSEKLWPVGVRVRRFHPRKNNQRNDRRPPPNRFKNHRNLKYGSNRNQIHRPRDNKLRVAHQQQRYSNSRPTTPHFIPPVQESTLRVIPSTITWMIRPLVTTFTSPIEITTMLTHGTSATGYVPIETVLYFLYSLLIILVIPILVFQVLTAMDIKVLLNISPN